MSELESAIEQRLIKQLCCDSSQWTYRPDITTEEKLWENFKYILEQNNKALLDDTPLSDSEFAKIKNDVSHASFYDAGKWLIGENGRVYVHIQRGSEPLHLVVLNNEHIAGGTSVYEVINQYQSFKTEEDERSRRFDVTLLINGLPLIHIELKNRTHSYKEAYRQIKKYISGGKFRGLFSNVQMFVVSNAVDTKYFAAARDTELKEKFMTRWLDEKNVPVGDYLDFARSVLRIPEAHEMVTKYTVLDNDKRQLLILRPYQIHAIELMRAASKRGKSGFIWHTTGSGKTMTSYKSARNLLMDIPSIEKTVFLIDRKDLDEKTTMDFQSYAQNDTIDVDDTDNVGSLIRRLADGNRQMIVTTRQKMQIMKKRVKPGSRYYNKIKGLKIAFVVDECHRAVTPQTKRDLESFFSNSVWYGFTGTPIFDVNAYEQKGDLAQTTEQLYGECLHSYTIKEAIHDEAVLGFMVENLGPKGMNLDEESRYYDTETHRRAVLDVILNHSYTKLGMQNGRGKTYEAILTVQSIDIAKKYYALLKKIVEGEDELKISEDVHKTLPDFPKFAITYSLSENKERSQADQEIMKEALNDYNAMFGTSYTIENIDAYNSGLNARLARKEAKYFSRDQQLDLVIVVDRLLTGFDAPCMSAIFMDRQPMGPHTIIQAFSRTNRLFDRNKLYGYVVTFQNHDGFKKVIDDALLLYSRGGSGNPVAEDFDTVWQAFKKSLKALRGLAPAAADVMGLSKKQKGAFVHLFRALDHDFAHLKAFSTYEEKMLDSVGFSEAEYEDYAAMYKNVMEELRVDPVTPEPGEEPVQDDYELVAYSRVRIDYEYIVELLRGVIESVDSEGGQDEFEKKLRELREIISEYAEDNPKLGAILMQLVDEIEEDKTRFMGQDISETLDQMRYAAANMEICKYAEKWFIDPEEVRYEAFHFRNGEIANENKLKVSADYTAYKASTPDPLTKFRFRTLMIKEFKEVLMPEIGPLIG